jgi:hypothetical protein
VYNAASQRKNWQRALLQINACVLLRRYSASLLASLLANVNAGLLAFAKPST